MPISTSRRRLLEAVVDDDKNADHANDEEGFVGDYPADDNLEPEDYFAYTKALWEEQDGPLEPMYQSWVQNILFLSNLQWWERDRVTGRWQQRSGPSWRRWPVTNLVLPFFRNMLAKATKQRPAWTAIPASLDSKDISSARLGEQVLEAKWVEIRMARTLRRFVGWTIVTGNGFLLPYWNEETGNTVPMLARVKVKKYDADTDEELGEDEIDCPCDEDGKPFMTAEGLYDHEHEVLFRDLGEVAVRAVSPFQLRVDPGAEEEEDVRWFIIQEAVPIRDLERTFPEFRGDFVESDTGDMHRYGALISGAGLGPDTQVVSGQIDPGEEVPKATIYHYHERPSEKYGEGRYWCVTDGILLQEADSLPDGIWPAFVHLKDLDIPGRYWGGCTLEAVVGLNREYNEVSQQILEHHQILLRGKWLVPIGSQIRRGTISQEPGEVIQHTPGLAPQQADIKPLPAAVYQERDRIKADFQMVTGIHRISMGEAPAGVTSGRAFLVLQEADDTELGPFIQALELAVAETAWILLKMMQRRYEDDRILRTVGKDQSYMIRSFRGADLEGVADIVPQAGSAFPWSQAAKQSALLDLLTAAPALFTDPQTGQLDTAKISRNIMVGGLESGYADADVDYNEVQREHSMFEAFAPGPELATLPPEQQAAALAQMLPKPEEWQNHVFHLAQHARLLKGAEIRDWSPEAQQAFIQHYHATVNKLGEIALQAQREQLELQRQQAAVTGGGAPGGAPGASPADLERTAVEREEQAVDQMADRIIGNEDPAGGAPAEG